MTGNDVFAAAAAYLSQSTADSEDLAPFVPLWLNVLLAECLPYENMLRARQGMEPLAEAPRLAQGAMDTDIPYREVILRTALPYGLASEFWRDDDNDYRTQDFRAKYISALGELQQTAPEPIADVYGPDAC